MRCAGCGAAVEASYRHCPSCGDAMPVYARVRPPETWEGIPVARHAPAPSGPPVVPDDTLPRPVHDAVATGPWASSRPSAARVSAARVSAARVSAARASATRVNAPRRRRRGWRVVAVLACSLALLVALWRLDPIIVGPLDALGALTPHTSTAAACPLPAVSATGPRALTAIQLATRLRNIAQGDFRPANTARTFTVGALAYITFKISTAAVGTASVEFCTPGEHIHGSLRVPSGSVNRYGQFSATFAPRDIGQGAAIVRWDGQVAGAVPYTVTEVSAGA